MTREPLLSLFRDKLSQKIWKLIAFLGLSAYMVVSIYPFLWMVSSALKDNSEVLTNTFLIAKQIHWELLLDVWNRLDFWQYFLNSLMISVPIVIGTIVVYSLAGYGFSVTKFWGKDFLYVFFMGLIVVPTIVVLVPLVQELRAFGFIGHNASKFATYMGLIIPAI